MPFSIVRNDLTKVKADAIVNTANPQPVIGAGTDLAVYTAAGADLLLAERRKIGAIPPGEAAVTPAFALPAKYIIHTVGPAWQGGEAGEFETLASCYRKPLLLARQLGCESIAFPLISTGTYGFPKDKALSVAIDTIEAFLREDELDVTLAVLNKEAFALSKERLADVQSYIDDRTAELLHQAEYNASYSAPRPQAQVSQRPQSQNSYKPKKRRKLFEKLTSLRKEESCEVFDAENNLPAFDADEDLSTAAKMAHHAAPAEGAAHAGGFANQSLSDRMTHLGDTFQERLLHLIDEQDLTDPEVYKKANLDRKLFSKIRSNAGYRPSKNTVLALAIALELDLGETKDLLARAGFAFSPSSKFDLIVQYCFEKRIYDIYEVNALLFQYDQPLLGSS